MTVSDGERLHRGSLTPEERSRWAVEAWRLNDRQNMSFRQIEEYWAGKGFRVSHVTIRKWVNEARTQSKILELYESSQVRLGLLGQLESYAEKVQAAMDNGEIGFEAGMKLLLQVGDRISKLTNAPVAPTTRVEVTNETSTVPNMALLAELRRVTEMDERQAEREASDGLG